VTSFKIRQRQVLILINIEFGSVAHIVMQQVVIKIDALTEKIVVFLWFRIPQRTQGVHLMHGALIFNSFLCSSGVFLCTSKVYCNKWLISNNPCVMTWWNIQRFTWTKFLFSSVIQPNSYSS
jgi:hypothetical protein